MKHDHHPYGPCHDDCPMATQYFDLQGNRIPRTPKPDVGIEDEFYRMGDDQR